MPALTITSPPDVLPARNRPIFQRFDPSRIAGTMTVDEWADFLGKSKHKYDYVYGKAVQVAGASPEHNLISMNTSRAIGNLLEDADSDCEVLGSDQKVYVNERLYYFLDLMIVCGDWQVDFRDALRNPSAIIEILSESTETDDRSDKFREYQQIPSLGHYVLIDPYRIAVTHYQKIAGGLWAIIGDYRALTDSLMLVLGETTVSVPLSHIYRRVSFVDTTPDMPTEE
jgi:Uma2 family endonuclease